MTVEDAGERSPRDSEMPCGLGDRYFAQIIPQHMAWVGRVKHPHRNASVIVLVIHENCVFTLEGERQTPIAAYLNGPAVFFVTVQWV